MDMDTATGSTPVPVVDPHNLRKLVDFIRAIEKATGMTGIGFDQSVIESEFTKDFDFLATSIRATIAMSLFKDASLKGWLTSAEREEFLITKVADYPLPEGLESFKAELFLAHLESVLE